MTSAGLLREYSWILILVVMVIYASLSLLRRWLISRRDKDFGALDAHTSPEERTTRLRLLSFFAILGIISFTVWAIMDRVHNQ